MIRIATIEDVPAILALGRRLHVESPRFSRLAFVEEKARNFIEYLIESPKGWVVVAEKDGQVIGGMAAILFEEWFSTDSVATDVSLFVAPEHRGSLTASRLIAAFRGWAESAGAAYAVAGASTGIHPEAVGDLYERLGAKRVGPVVEFTWES